MCNYRRRKRGASSPDEFDELSACEHRANIQAFGSNYTLCLFLKEFRHESILEKSWDSLNVTIFGAQNSSEDLAISTLTLKYATGYVLGSPTKMNRPS